MIRKLKPYFLISPLLILYLIFIGGGLFEIFKESLGYIPALELTEISFESYWHLLLEKDFIKNNLFSLYLAFTATLFSTFFGIVIAYLFVTSKNGYIKRAVKKILQTGLVLPYIYVVFLAVLLLNQTGFFSRIMFQTGLINDLSDFPVIIFDQWGIGILLVYIFKGTPFVTLFVINVMSRISGKFGDVARSLGAGEVTILRKIYIPLSSNTIIWSSSIIFAYFLGSFEVPYLLGSMSPVALSSKLYSLSMSADLLAIPQSMALSLIVFFTGLFFVASYSLSLNFILKGKF